MQFLKKHYEKVILSVVLLGLAVAAALLPIKIGEAQESVKTSLEKLIDPQIKALAPLDLSTNTQAIARLQNPTGTLTLSFPHYLFNPVQWQRKSDGSAIKTKTAEDVSRSLRVVSIAPLHLDVIFQGAVPGEDRYQVSVSRETDRAPRVQNFISKVGDRNTSYVLREIKGPKDAPTELVLELLEDKRTISISKEKPFRTIVGYIADLRNEVDNRSFPKQKQGNKLTFGKEAYKIIEINEKEVVLSQESTGKRTILAHLPAPKS